MKIEPYERLSFKVFTTDRRNLPKEYIVDFEENGGKGACSCQNYDYVQRPIKGRCKHMKDVLTWLGEAVIAKQHNKTRKEIYENTCNR